MAAPLKRPPEWQVGVACLVLAGIAITQPLSGDGVQTTATSGRLALTRAGRRSLAAFPLHGCVAVAVAAACVLIRHGAAAAPEAALVSWLSL